MSDSITPDRLKKLLGFNVEEVSLVGEGANGERFFLTKSAEGKMPKLDAQGITAILGKEFERKEAILKSLDALKLGDEERAAAEAIIKMRQSYGAKLGNDFLKALATDAGMNLEPVKKDADPPILDPAAVKALATLTAIRAALGDGQPAEAVAKIRKALGEPADGLGDIPEHVRKALDAQKAELERVSKALGDEQDRRLTDDATHFAESLKSLPASKDEIVNVIKAAHKFDPALRAQVEKMLTAAHTVVAKSAAFWEHGSSRTGGGDEGDDEFIAKARAWKTETKFTGSDEQAVAAFAKTSDGRAMHSRIAKARKEGGR